MRDVALWFDGGGSYGFGNVRRTRELGERLAARGHRVTFRPLSASAAALLGLAAARDTRASHIVLDLPYQGDEVLQNARATGAWILALDYEGKRTPDLIVSLQPSAVLPVGASLHCGAEFAIIRKEILQARDLVRRGDTVLVIVGGGDRGVLSEQIVHRLVPTGAPVVVVQGPNGGALEGLPSSVEVHCNPADLPKLMASCAWAVSTGGTTMLEMLCLGKAVHVVPRTDAEERFARRFRDAGALLGIGLHTLALPSSSALAKAEQVGPALVDGQGCERIAELLETLS